MLKLYVEMLQESQRVREETNEVRRNGGKFGRIYGMSSEEGDSAVLEEAAP